jgi:hypothetical protein
MEGGFGELFGAIGEFFGGVSEAAEGGVEIGAAAVAAASESGGGEESPTYSRHLTGAPRILNVNDR